MALAPPTGKCVFAPQVLMTKSDSDSARTAISKHRQGPIPPWILCCLVAAATMLSVSIGVGWCLGVSDVKGSSPRPTAQRNVLFTIDLIALDPLQNIVTLDWWIVGDDCIASNASSAESAALPCPVVNIYVNPTQFLSSGGSARQPLSDSDVGSQPTFQHNLNATAFALSGPAAQPAFRTQLDVRPHSSRARVDLVDYPFDRYSATALIFAQTNDTGEAVGAWVFNLTGTAFGFVATLGDTGVDANSATSVNILFNHALSVKLYVITIIIGMASQPHTDDAHYKSCCFSLQN